MPHHPTREGLGVLYTGLSSLRACAISREILANQVLLEVCGRLPVAILTWNANNCEMSLAILVSCPAVELSFVMQENEVLKSQQPVKDQRSFSIYKSSGPSQIC
ncbi:hypothetical protein TWF173_010213 [Orbilia oligospora]|nr:hypothetical protein TWF173_010213 [Orbilia oligospora]